MATTVCMQGRYDRMFFFFLAGAILQYSSLHTGKHAEVEELATAETTKYLISLHVSRSGSVRKAKQSVDTF
jgi:hypothetical protein